MATETNTFYPGERDINDQKFYQIAGWTNPVGKGSDNSSNYAGIELTRGQGEETWTRWPFDCSSIPAGATIDSVSCNVAASITRTASYYVVSRTLQMCSGTTAKGSATTIVGTSRSVHVLNCGSWTRDELQKANLYIYAKRAQSNYTTDTSIYFYGADLTVQYTYQSQKFMLKLPDSYHDIARVFQKIDDIWIEQDDLNNVVVSENGLVNGGEIESAGPALITFSIDGTSYQAEEGMTAEEWVASSYNTDGCLIVNYYGTLCLTTSNSRRVLRTDGSNVVSTDVLDSGDAYTIN